MTRINLLPWREEDVLFKNRIFAVLSGVVFILALIFQLPFIFITTYHLGVQEKNIEILSNEITSTKNTLAEIKEIKESIEQYIQKQTFIAKLTKRRNLVVEILNSLNTSVPEDVILIEVEKNVQGLNIIGISESHLSVSNLMRNLELVPWIKSQNLKDVSNEERDKYAINFLIEITTGEI